MGRQRQLAAGGRRSRLVAEAELLVGDMDNVPMKKRGLLNALAIDKGAVGAAQITNVDLPTEANDLGVFLGDMPGVDAIVGGCTPTNGEGKSLQQQAMGAFAPLGIVLQ